MSQFPEQFLIDVQPPKDPWDSHVNPAVWKNSILVTLQKIATSDAGMALLRSIQLATQWILAQPTVWGECNAHGAASRAVSRSGRFYTGVLNFAPGSYVQGSACFKQRQRGNRGFLPDEVMFHELIHAHRGSLRLSLNSADNARLGGGLFRYGREEEFLAIVLMNIYISDETNRNSSGLRADHYGGRPLEASLSTSLGFFRSSPQVLPLLTKFAEQQKFLFQKLAEVKSTFNPCAALLDHPLEVQKLSHSRLANERERSVPKMRIPSSQNHPPAPNLIEGLKSLGAELAEEALRMLRR